MEAGEAPYRFDAYDSHAVLMLFPLINEGQWGNASQVGTEILARLESIKRPALIIDLSPLDYMGSAQVALLVRVWKSLKKVDGSRMVVQCPGDMVREVLTIAGLKSLWEIVPTRAEAMKLLGISPSGRRKTSVVLPLLSGAAAVIAATACGLLFANVDVRIVPEVLSWVALGSGSLGLLTGMIGGVSSNGWGRGVCLAALVLSSGAGAATCAQFPPWKKTADADPADGPEGTGKEQSPAAEPETAVDETAKPPAGGAAVNDGAGGPKSAPPGQPPEGLTPGGPGRPMQSAPPGGTTAPPGTPPGTRPGPAPGGPADTATPPGDPQGTAPNAEPVKTPTSRKEGEGRSDSGASAPPGAPPGEKPGLEP